MSTTAAPELPPDASDDRRAAVIGVVSFCLVFSTFMVSLRLWTRKVIINQLGPDDYVCILGLIATYGSGIAMAHMTKYGLGRHVYLMALADIPLYLREFYLSIVFYCGALLFIKLAFLFQYYRVLAVQHMRVVYIVAIIIVGGWALSQLLVGIFICTPIEGFWNSTIESKCIPNIPQWYINAAGNIITDVAVFALPLPALWSLNLAKGHKYVLVGIFSLGFFTVIISVIRIRYLKNFDDFPWETVDSSLWSIGELTSALTCVCLPTLQPFVARYMPGLVTLIGGTKATANSGGSYRPSRRGNPESGPRSEAKRQLSSAGDGSQVELSSQPTKSGNGSNPFEGSYIVEDGRSVASNTSDLALAPRQPGVGVRTSIGPAETEPNHKREFSGGVQVQREVFQVRSPSK